MNASKNLPPFIVNLKINASLCPGQRSPSLRQLHCFSSAWLTVTPPFDCHEGWLGRKSAPLMEWMLGITRIALLRASGYPINTCIAQIRSCLWKHTIASLSLLLFTMNWPKIYFQCAIITQLCNDPGVKENIGIVLWSVSSMSCSF